LALDEFVFSLTGQVRPRVCYLGTASGDCELYIESFYEVLGRRCEASHLPLFRPPFTLPPAEALANQHVIYVGGGSTPNLLAIWRLHGIDELLRSAWEGGTVLYGASAGGLCWFESGVTDSLEFDGVLRPFLNGLGFLPGSHCPHYDSEGQRRPTYRRLVRDGSLPAGYAVDDFAALHFSGAELVGARASRAGANAYRVEAVDGGVVETPLIS
jgi:dipeptidase E